MYPASFFKIFIFFILITGLSACKHNKKVYTSDCNDGHTFKRISLAHLVDSLDFYNNKYIEVSGKYQQDKALSTLTGDKPGIVISVEFSNGCPLFLTGTRVGFFDYDNNNGQLTPANNKAVTLRGLLICHKTASFNTKKASISRISYVQL